ncbi:hypothetical protein FEM48_Zijuj10G0074600 [Ziziphus jujuba var. spinosa]|uniref:FAR1 domain-containing protein n=1 Tax=Ziziphus jujuba var. spinosa TaxID=714518 RepID=A0A978UM39_ZIZJJ|nr:hypothetical protein FEM48_Zijuj10G0074600 [Ziziphus jujuba var. spinosa]
MQAQLDPIFNEYVLRTGDGIEQVIYDDNVKVPFNMVIPYIDEDDDDIALNRMIDHVLPHISDYANNLDTMINRDIDNKEIDTTTSTEDKIEPKIGMVFYSHDELVEYYKFYRKEKGFEISKRTSSKGDYGEVKYITLACSRNGKSKCTSRSALKLHPVIKTGCQTKLRAIKCPDGRWLIDSIVLEHNHELNLATDSDDKCNMVMEVIHNLKMKLILNEGIDMRAQTISDKENSVSNKNGKKSNRRTCGSNSIVDIEKAYAFGAQESVTLVNRTLNFRANETFSDGLNEFYGSFSQVHGQEPVET